MSRVRGPFDSCFTLNILTPSASQLVSYTSVPRLWYVNNNWIYNKKQYVIKSWVMYQIRIGQDIFKCNRIRVNASRRTSANNRAFCWPSLYTNYPTAFAHYSRFYLLLFNLAFIQSAPGAIRIVRSGLISHLLWQGSLSARCRDVFPLGLVYTFNSGTFHRAQNVIESYRILRTP